MHWEGGRVVGSEGWVGDTLGGGGGGMIGGTHSFTYRQQWWCIILDHKMVLHFPFENIAVTVSISLLKAG